MGGFLRVVEQRDLLGGADLVYGDRRRSRRVHVDGKFKVGFAAALALIVGRARAENPLAPEHVEEKTRCPHCGREGSTQELFGTRVLGGERRPQSWCRPCRSAARRAERLEPVQEVLALP
ncbi:MAG TPA: hypothetical protein VND93_06095 [Myxococcales bacterium]|nr:hypothetical protein [Myxococcales bacterium]